MGRNVAALTAATLVLAIGALMSTPQVGHASQCRPIGLHQLGRDPQGVAIELRRTGGLFPPATVTVYNDGRIAASGPVRLLEPQRQLSRPTLAGLLKLAEAEGFYSMPANILCRTTATDVRTASISIHTTSGVRTVALLSVCKASSFTQLYSVIVAATGTTITA